MPRRTVGTFNPRGPVQCCCAVGIGSFPPLTASPSVVGFVAIPRPTAGRRLFTFDAQRHWVPCRHHPRPCRQCRQEKWGTFWYTVVIVGSIAVATVKYWYVMVPLDLAVLALFLVLATRRKRRIALARAGARGS